MVDAAFYQNDLGEAYFFSVDKYCRVRWEPYTSIEKRTWGPALIRDHWKSLAQAGFDTVDAVLPVEGVADELFFFRGPEVVRIRFRPKSGGDTIVEGPLKTLDKWKSLAGTTVERVGASLAVPGRPNEAYLFSGTNYVKLDLVRDKVLYGPTAIVKEWPGIAKAGFDSVDAALQVPEDKAKQPGETYFFREGQFARAQVVPSKPDVLQWGPAKWEDHWKTLDWIAGQTPSKPQSPPPGQSGSQGQGQGQGQGQQPPAQGKPTPQPLISGLHMQQPMGRTGKNNFAWWRNAAVVTIETWEGYWYATEYWGIRKMRITNEVGQCFTFGTDINAQRYNAISFDPHGGERITNFTTRIGEIWDHLSITTNRGGSFAVGNPNGGVRYSWELGNGVLAGFRGCHWPPEIVKVGPVWGR